jgi:tetratricopeptide (TPR) repeat protein
MKPDVDLFDRDGIERLLDAAERDPRASEELDFLADLVAAAELERGRLARKAAPLRAARRSLSRPWLLAAAASVLLLLALGAWLLARGGERPTHSLAAGEPPRFVASELRDPDSARDGEFARAMEPYVRADWTTATLALEEWLHARPDHGPAHFYLAAAREQLGELDTAEEHYEAARRAPDELLSDHARFRLALLLLRRGELERARAELGALQAGGGELARNAGELLGELER